MPWWLTWLAVRQGEVRSLQASIGPAELAWTQRKLPRNLLKVGDVVYVKDAGVEL